MVEVLAVNFGVALVKQSNSRYVKANKDTVALQV